MLFFKWRWKKSFLSLFSFSPTLSVWIMILTFLKGTQLFHYNLFFIAKLHKKKFQKESSLPDCQLLHFVFVEIGSTILNYKRPIPLSIFDQLENSLTLSSCSESHYRSKLSLDHRSFSTGFQRVPTSRSDPAFH